MPTERPRPIADLEDLWATVELSDVHLVEEHCARKGKSSIPLDKLENNSDNPAHVSLDIKTANSRFTFRVKVVHESLAARVSVEYEATYSSKDSVVVSHKILEKFASHVLINTLFPMARNAIYAAWARLGVRSKHLGLLRISDIAPSQNPGPDLVASGTTN